MPVSIPPFQKNNLLALIQQLFLLQAIGPFNNANSFNGPAWSISTEFYTYMIFGLTVLWAKRYNIICLILICLTAFYFITNGETLNFNETAMYGMGLCLAGFTLGCLTAAIKQHITLEIPSLFSYLAVALLILFLGLNGTHKNEIFIFFLTALLIISLVLSKESRLKTVLNWKVFTWLGTLSYSVYMSQSFVLWAVDMFLRRTLKIPTLLLYNTPTPQLTFPEALLATLAVIAVILGMSQLIYQYIEKPLREKSRQVIF